MMDQRAETDASISDASMSCGPDASNAERLAVLDGYDILDTPREESFDRITRLAKKLFRVPMVSITLIDGHRQWFKSEQGMASRETPRSSALCNVAMRSAGPLVVEDATLDPRFADNEFVTGAPHIRFYAGAPLRSPDGHALGTLCVIDRTPREFGADDVDTLNELAQIVMDEMELRLLANTDVLTGSLSRRSFREEAKRAHQLAVRHAHDLSLLVLDFDHFKSVNDAHGHPAGDVVLTRSVAACTALLRASDAIGRLGGEEFAILLPHTGAREAMDVAERLREAIAAERYSVGSATFQVTASFGVAAKSDAAGDFEALVSEADAALYLAKAQGRNRCVAARGVSSTAKAQPRRRVLKGGRILFNRRQSSRECTVKSLWDSGAGIDVSTAAGLPDRFELAIDADEVLRSCQIVRTEGQRIDVEFV